MGLGVVILLYGFVSVGLVFVLWIVAWPFRSWLHAWPKLTSALRIAPFIGAAVPMAAFVAGMVWDNFAPPEFVYQAVFDRRPDSAITGLHGQSNATNDAREVFLSFRDADAAFSRALSTARFEPADVAKSDGLVPLPGDTPPDWWTADHCLDRTVYVANHARRWDQIVMTRCRSDATIYVQARWVD